jgi:hypothetical protein
MREEHARHLLRKQAELVCGATINWNPDAKKFDANRPARGFK